MATETPDFDSQDKEERERIVEQIFAAARAIPVGKVTSYGALGKKSDPPISGYICGRILGNVADDVPWWRIVGKDGQLPIRKRHPELGIKQRETLQSEGVRFDAEGKIEARFFEENETAEKPDSAQQGQLF